MPYQFVICDGRSERQDTVASIVEEAFARLDWKSFRQVRISTLTERPLWPRTVFYSHLFLLSLELDGVPELGWELYRKNHWAPIVFYGTRKQAEPINDLLRARPAAFWNTENGEEELRELLQIQLSPPFLSLSILPVETGNQRLYLPQPSILSVVTGRPHYVDVCYEKRGAVERFCRVSCRATVNEMEKALSPSRFLRIHKSFLVGLRYIRRFDKRSRRIELANGESLPISDRYYAEVRERLLFFDA